MLEIVQKDSGFHAEMGCIGGEADFLNQASQSVVIDDRIGIQVGQGHSPFRKHALVDVFAKQASNFGMPSVLPDFFEQRDDLRQFAFQNLHQVIAMAKQHARDISQGIVGLAGFNNRMDFVDGNGLVSSADVNKLCQRHDTDSPRRSRLIELSAG